MPNLKPATEYTLPDTISELLPILGNVWPDQYTVSFVSPGIGLRTTSTSSSNCSQRSGLSVYLNTLFLLLLLNVRWSEFFFNWYYTPTFDSCPFNCS